MKTVPTSSFTTTRIFRTTAMVRSIVRAYADGDGLETIAARYGTTVPSVRLALVKNGVTIRPRGRPVLAG